MLPAKKYVAVCLGLHRMGHDKVTSMKQSTDKRYINARTHLQRPFAHVQLLAHVRIIQPVHFLRRSVPGTQLP